MNKRIKIPMAAVAEIKRLQWQVEQAFGDLEKKCSHIKELESENIHLRKELKKYELPN